MKRALIALSLLVAGTVASQAQTGLTLGAPTYGGTGCPSGTAAVALSGQTLSILYDQFVAEAGGPTGRTFDRKSCNLAIPVNVPNGISVSIVSVDYRGYNGLPSGANSVFRVEYFFAGGTGPVFNQTFTGPRQQDFTLRNNIVAAANVWSACGQDVILRTNASIRVTTSGGQQAVATVDTTDVNAAIVFHLQYRAC
ncbi:MAG: DUF4360 domain-containing protein [Bauldia sp.]|nr:DUF4360 domain-containing protein [Bauldia sp.]MCW5719396.1 DUF4360 domain-containing protein [Bauldia sp.]